MPKQITPLSDFAIRHARPRAKSYKLADGGGLYLEITPAGSKLWRMKYRRSDGRENKLHFGAYPEVSLLRAREKRATARKLIAEGIDPGKARDEERRRVSAETGRTFEVVARDWHRVMAGRWQPGTAKKTTPLGVGHAGLRTACLRKNYRSSAACTVPISVRLSAARRI